MNNKEKLIKCIEEWNKETELKNNLSKADFNDIANNNAILHDLKNDKSNIEFWCEWLGCPNWYLDNVDNICDNKATVSKQDCLECWRKAFEY